MLRALLLLSCAVALRAASPVEGDWIGTVDFGVQKLRIVFHISSDAEGHLRATADSPDQGAKGLPVESVSLQERKVEIRMTGLGASFSGGLTEDGSEVRGTFEQAGAKVPLLLRRMKPGEVAATPKRPQVPKRPFPYEEREVDIENNQAPGVRLAATLTMPKGDGPFPGVVLVTGSGPQTRDEIVANHPVFLVLADYLTRNGIAVLRYDDRGIGSSTGAFAKATTADFATDASAALAFLRSQRGVKSAGILGHSEGAIIAAMLAGRGEPAFAVLMCAPAVPGRDIILAQKEAILKASGAPKPDLSHDAKFYDALATGADDATIRSILNEAGAPPAAIDRVLANEAKSPWFRHFLTYDPAQDIAKMKGPVLVLFGEKDLQVLPAQNEPAVRAVVAKSGNKQVRIEVLAGLNHLLQTATTGSPAEYAQIEETISPRALEKIAAWVKAQGI